MGKLNRAIHSEIHGQRVVSTIDDLTGSRLVTKTIPRHRLRILIRVHQSIHIILIQTIPILRSILEDAGAAEVEVEVVAVVEVSLLHDFLQCQSLSLLSVIFLVAQFFSSCCLVTLNCFPSHNS